MKHILKSIVICIVIAAVIGYFFYTPDYYDKDGNLLEKQDMGFSKYKMRPTTVLYNPADGDPSTWVNGVPGTGGTATDPGTGTADPGTGTAADPGTGTAVDPGTGTTTDPGTGTAADSGTGTAADSGTGTAADSGAGTAADSGAGTAADSGTGTSDPGAGEAGGSTDASASGAQAA